MASSYSLDALVESVKRRGAIPKAQSTFTSDDFKSIANEELLTYILPILQARREDYYLAEKMVTVATPDKQVGIYPAWKIPHNAIASTLRDVQGVGSNGDYFALGRIVADDLPTLTSNGFFLYGEYVVLAFRSNRMPMPTQLRLIFHRRPSFLVYENDAFLITQITNNGGDLEITATGAVATATATVNAVVDFSRGTPGFDNIFSEVAVTIDSTQSSTTYTITVASGYATYASQLSNGDFVSATGTTPCPQIPLELFPLLAQRMVVKFLEAQGESEQLASAMKLMEEMESKIPLLIQPRVEGKPKKIIPRFNLWRRWRW